MGIDKFFSALLLSTMIKILVVSTLMALSFAAPGPNPAADPEAGLTPSGYYGGYYPYYSNVLVGRKKRSNVLVGRKKRSNVLVGRKKRGLDSHPTPYYPYYGGQYGRKKREAALMPSGYYGCCYGYPYVVGK